MRPVQSALELRQDAPGDEFIARLVGMVMVVPKRRSAVGFDVRLHIRHIKAGVLFDHASFHVGDGLRPIKMRGVEFGGFLLRKTPPAKTTDDDHPGALPPGAGDHVFKVGF